MIEVVFNESTKGSMKIAKDFVKTDYHKASVDYIGDPIDKSLLEKMNDGKAIGGSRNDVVCLPLNLDMGDISSPVLHENRKAFIFEMIKNPNKKSDDSKVDENDINQQYWNNIISDFNKLVECAQKGEHIRIWYSNTPESLCGFYYINDLLKDCACRLSAVKLPEYHIVKKDYVRYYKSWAEIHPGKFHSFLKYETEILETERSIFRSYWKELQIANGPLRASINGKIMSVDASFYDMFIRRYIPKGEFLVARAIGEILGNGNLSIGEWWIRKRIELMIASGELTIVANHDSWYRMVLKKCK